MKYAQIVVGCTPFLGRVGQAIANLWEIRRDWMSLNRVSKGSMFLNKLLSHVLPSQVYPLSMLWDTALVVVHVGSLQCSVNTSISATLKCKIPPGHKHPWSPWVPNRGLCGTHPRIASRIDSNDIGNAVAARCRCAG